jgi:hypothetical protein
MSVKAFMCLFKSSTSTLNIVDACSSVERLVFPCFYVNFKSEYHTVILSGNVERRNNAEADMTLG